MNIEHVEEKILLMNEEEEIGHLSYAVRNQIFYANGVVVDPKHRSKGLAQFLVDESVTYAKEHDLKIMPICPYVVSLFDRGGYEDIDAR